MKKISLSGLRFRLLPLICSMMLVAVISGGVSAQSVPKRIGPSTESELTAPTPTLSAHFGGAIAADGNRVVIGAAEDRTSDGAERGSAYVYRKDGASWILEARLEGSIDSEAFGASVAIDGDQVVVGSPYEWFEGARGRGAAYIFRRHTSGEWQLEKKITRVSPSFTPRFGQAVALDGDTVAVTMWPTFDRGSIHVFRKVNNEWTDETILRDETPTSTNGFGMNVDMSGDTIVAGERFAQHPTGAVSGAVIIFARSEGSWQTQVRILGPTTSETRFGSSVAMDNDTLVIGAPSGALGEPFAFSGGAHVYTRESGSWTFRQRLQGIGPEGWTGFGTAVSVSPDRIVVGAPGATAGTGEPGAAYYFRREGNLWLNGTRLLAADTNFINTYGTAVAVSGRDYFSGSPSKTVNGISQAGSVELFIEPAAIPDLAASSDSGVSSTDNITNAADLVFTIETVTPGSTVELLRNGSVVASALANVNNVSLTDLNVPAGSSYAYTSRQTTNGEISSQSEALSVTVDRAGPAVVVEQFGSDPTTSASVSFTILGSEALFGIEADDLSFEGTTADLSQATTVITPPQVHPIPWLATINGVIANPAVVRVSLPAGRFTDAAGNLNDASVSLDNTITVDSVKPTVTIEQDPQQPDPATAMPLKFKVNFSEPVTGFTSTDISFTFSTANTATRVVSVTGSGASYDVSVSGISANGQVIVVSIPAGSANDSIGNGNLASTSSDNIITVDTVVPTVSINQAPDQPDPTFLRPVRFRVGFSESVTGFDSSDISFAGSTVDVSAATIAINTSGNFQVVEVSSVTGPGILRVSIAAGAAVDAAGNPTSASTSGDNQVTLYAPFANISGRITNSQGVGVRLVTIKVTLPDGSIIFRRTNDFGYYNLRNLPTGRISLELTAKPSHLLTQSFDLVEDRADYNFIFN